MANAAQTTLLPILSNDPSDRIIQGLRRLDPSINYQKWRMIQDYPAMDDYECLLHYFRGAAGRIIDLLRYVDFGVGFKLKPKDFPNEEQGDKARDEILEDMKKRNFEKTINRAGVFNNVLSRCCIVKTLALDDTFYYNDTEKITGYDAINPMTLDIESVREALIDQTGQAVFKQYGIGPQNQSQYTELTQDRVIYKTNNPVTDQSPLGAANIQKCTKDLRALAGFPDHRGKLAKLYSEMFSIVKINTDKIGQNPIHAQITSSVKEAQDFLDETAQFYRDQMTKGSVVAVFDWEDFEGKSWAGKEVKLQDLEISTLDSICFKFGVPMPMLRYSNLVNRDTLPSLVDTFIREREKGPRRYFYTPLIEDYCKDILEQRGYTQGYMEVEYNPFLTKDYLAMSQIISNLYPTGSISNPEIRDMMDWDQEMNMGGDNWDEDKVMPNKQQPVYTHRPAIQGTPGQQPNQVNEGQTIQASLDLFKEIKTNPYYDLFY